MRIVLLAIALGAALSLAPSAAEAQVPTLGSEECDTLCGVAWFGGALGGAALAIGELWLIIDGVIRAEHGHGLFEDGAIVEVILGLAHFAPAAVSTWAVLTDDPDDPSDDPDLGWVGVGFASGALAAYFFVHGLWSLTGGRPPPSHFQIGAAPQPGGAGLFASGTF